MTLLNRDGSPYSPVGTTQQFDPENPEHELFVAWDEEAIRWGGSPLYYYECFIQFQTMDKLYLEDRSKIFSNNPIELWCSYDPKACQNLMNAFGFDSPDEVKFELNYRAVLQAIGHPPKLGSRLFTPHLRENWIVVQRNLGEFKMWSVIRIELLCQRFQESSTTGEGRVSQKEPDYKIDKIVP